MINKFKYVRKFYPGGPVEMREVVVTAPRLYVSGYDDSGNPVYTENSLESMGYNREVPTQTKRLAWANGNQSTAARDLGRLALAGIGAPLLAASPFGAAAGRMFFSDPILNGGLIASKTADTYSEINNDNLITGTAPLGKPSRNLLDVLKNIPLVGEGKTFSVVPTKWSIRSSFAKNTAANDAERRAARDLAKDLKLPQPKFGRGRPSYTGEIEGLTYNIKYENPSTITHKVSPTPLPTQLPTPQPAPAPAPALKLPVILKEGVTGRQLRRMTGRQLDPKTESLLQYRNKLETRAEDEQYGNLGRQKAQSDKLARTWATNDGRHASSGRTKDIDDDVKDIIRKVGNVGFGREMNRKYVQYLNAKDPKVRSQLRQQLRDLINKYKSGYARN